MGCLKCGKPYLKVEGNCLICSCGYMETVKMPDDANTIELFETDLDRLIMVGHKQGLTYPRIFCCILNRLQDMVLQCSTEQWLEHGDRH